MFCREYSQNYGGTPNISPTVQRHLHLEGKFFFVFFFFCVFQPGFVAFVASVAAVAFVGVWLLWLYHALPIYISIYLSNLT